jgi:hypothetical protein
VPLLGPTDPSTTTTVPPDPTTTTTAAPPTTSTTAAPSTTTTTRATTTTTRRHRTTTTTTAVATVGGTAPGQSAGPTRPGGAAPSRHPASSPSTPGRTTDAPSARVGTPSASGERIEPVTAGSVDPASAQDRLRSDFARSTTAAAGHGHGFDASALAGILLAVATALVLGLAQRDAVRQRRAQATLVGSGALKLGRDESEAGVREQLRSMLVSGPFTATGSDCRSLQLLVQAAAHEGLEVRDPRGDIVRATDRLVQAYGSVPDHKRLPLRWAVQVTTSTVEVPEGYSYVLERTGPDERGRVLAFTPGTEMRLWTGDCL